MSRLLVRSLFGLLIVATVAAFFIAQRIKQSTPVVEKVRFTKYFSPNGDGVRDAAAIKFRLKRTDSVDVEIVGPGGDLVRRVASDRRICGPCTHRFRWDGRTASGRTARDGTYFLRVVLREQARSVTSPRKLFLDTTPPRPLVKAVTPNAISPDGDGLADSARIVYEGPAGEVGGSTAPEFRIYRTGLRTAKEVARIPGRRGRRITRWRGFAAGSPAPAGNYLVSVRVRDAAGNLGASAGLRPQRGSARGAPGVRVRYLEAVAPERAVRGGNRAVFHVRTERARYRWAIRRLGAGRPARRGSSSARTLAPKVPGRPGVYLLELAAGRFSYRTPFAVRSVHDEPLLVVVPALAWQASNLYDANQDGWGEVLSRERQAERRRPLTGDGLPRGLTSALRPVLRALDAGHARYDVTTDLALASGRGPSLEGREGVLFAGDERLYPAGALRGLGRWVRDGGRVGWLGIDSFHRGVRIGRARLVREGRGRDDRGFAGERTMIEHQQPVSLEPGRDAIGFFSAALPSFGSYGTLERSIEIPRGNRLLAGAGPPTGGLAIPVYRHGKGVVARVNPGGYPGSLASDARARALFGRLVSLLGGGR